MRVRGLALNATPSFAKPDADQHWWIWPVWHYEARMQQQRGILTHVMTLRLLCFRLSAWVACEYTPSEWAEIEAVHTARQREAERVPEGIQINRFTITVTPSFWCADDREWHVWPWVVYRPQVMRLSGRVWRSETLQFQVLFARLTFAATMELGERARVAERRAAERQA